MVVRSQPYPNRWGGASDVETAPYPFGQGTIVRVRGYRIIAAGREWQHPQRSDDMRIPLAALLLLLTLPAGPTAAEPLIEEHAFLTVELDHGPTRLETIAVKQEQERAARLPIALITHGTPRDRDERARKTADSMLPQARDFAHRGWLAVAVLRRGFGRSDGGFVEGYDCRDPDYGRALRTAAADLLATLRAISVRRDADPSRVIGIGASVGGAAMLTLASEHPPGLLAIVNISGGTGAYASGKNCDEDRLADHFTQIGGAVRIPTIWFYAANDSYFASPLVRRLFDGFTAAGGIAELYQFGPLKSDGHELWGAPDGRKLWLPELDRFLRTHGLPSWERAAAQSLSAHLSPAAKRILGDYLDAGSEKAFAVAPAGSVGYWSGADSAAEARAGAIRECQKAGGANCSVAMEDFAAVAPHRAR
jgi:pimeloyl-ACP methyl ester carboxylesterase